MGSANGQILSTQGHKYDDVFLAGSVFAGTMASFFQTMPRTSPFTILLSGAERRQLESQARKYTSSYYSVVRARIILMAADGLSNDEIGARLSLPRQVVSKWRKRFFDQRTAGLHDEPRTGRPPGFSP